MNRDSRLPRLLTALALLSGLTACTQSSEDSEKPTLAEATKQLLTDADKLLASVEVRESGQIQATERAENDKNGACLTGQTQRFFRAQGNFLHPEQQAPGVATGSIGSVLRLLNYELLVDDLDIYRDDLSVVALRRTGVTFLIAARSTPEPHILIVGKTDCLRVRS